MMTQTPLKTVCGSSRLSKVGRPAPLKASLPLKERNRPFRVAKLDIRGQWEDD